MEGIPLDAAEDATKSTTSTHSTTSTTSTASTTSPEAEFPTSETKSSTFDISGLNTLYLFYIYTQGSFPSIEERALIWQEKKLGLAEEYWGFSFQNEKLLELLKAELTQ